MAEGSKWILPLELLENSPSRADGVTSEEEKTKGYKSAWFMEVFGESIGSKHRLVVSTACVLFHRFFAFQSYKKHDRFIIATTCIFIAGKVEESPIRVEHIIDHYLRIRSRFPIKSNEPLGDKGSLVDKVKIAERIVLHTLCFDLAVNHPYANFRKAFIFMKENNYIVPPLPHSEVAHIEKAREEQMVVLYRDTALELIHNSFRTNLCLKQTTNYIAIAATYLTTLRLKLKPPCGNPRDVENQWFEILYEYLKCKKFTRSVMVEICSDILDCIEFRCHAQGEGQTHPHSIDLVGIEELRNQLNTLLTFHREIDAKELKSNVVFSNSTMSSISMSVSNTDNSAGTDISTNMKLIYKETRSNTVSTDAAAQNANTENSEESRKSLQQSGVDNSSSAGVSAYEKGTSDSVGVSSVSGQSSSEVTNTPSVSTETVNPPSKHDFNGKAMASTPTPPPPPPPPDTEYCTSEARCDNNGVYANVECEHNAKYVSESSHTKRSQQSVELDMLPPPPPPPDTPVLEPFSNTATPINTATASTNIKLIPTAGITSICNGAAIGTACLDMDSKPTTNTIGNSNATSVEVNTRKRPIGVIESEMNTRNGAIDYCKAMSMDSIADEQSLNKYKKFEGDVSINTDKTSVTTTSLLCDNNTDANGLSNASVVLDKLAQYQANVGNMLLSVDEKPHLPQ